ncbi:MAG TPA: two-component regulator propeller domain-containing protein [Blastocatellia bacterium]|nr:two-component regulator propeller domain-containing protein [Blastocatellia bacterium]
MPHPSVTTPYARPRARVPLFACWLICACAAATAAAQYRFDASNTDSGLPNNFVHTIVQTRDGYLWFTTLDGLVRSDGARLTVFNTVNTRELPTNRFSALFEDRAGALWIGAESDGLIKYQSGKFTVYTTKDGLPDNNIIAIHEEDRGALVVTTQSGFVRRQQERFVPHVPDQPGLNKIFGYRGRRGMVWDIGQTGPNRFADAVSASYRALQISPRAFVVSASEDRMGNYWIGTAAGLIRLRNGSSRLYTEKDGLPKRVVPVVKEDREGNLWAGTSDGLCQLKDGRFISRGLAGSYITALIEDREGALWIATWGAGVYRMSKQAITVYTDKHGLAANNVYPIFEDRAGQVWMGTWERGLTRYRDGRFSRFPDQNGQPGRLVTALSEDDAGRLWIGNFGGAMWFKDGKLTDFTNQLPLPNPAVQVILQDRAGNLWFGSTPGLVKYRDGKATLYTTKDGLAGDDVRAILEDRQGRIWVGTYSGVTQIAGGKFVSYTKSGGLSSNRVRALYEDDAGALWIGTYDGGLSRIKDGKIVNITMNDGLFNNGVFQILEDSRGNFWMSCNLGVYRASKQQLNDFADGKILAVNSISYGKRDGMLNPECNGGPQPAGVKTRDGKLWFPTQHGVAVIDPENIPSNPVPPPVVIESCLLDRAVVDFSDYVQMAPGQQNLEIQYTALSFVKPEQIRFKHRLEGLDQDWVDAGTRRTVHYSHIPPGVYEFTVIAANSDGVWNNEGRRLRIVALPPFYLTWWFITVVSAGATGLALLFYRRRIAQLKRAHAAQEAFSRRLIESQESERKRIAAELHDSLGQSLAIIRNRALFGLGASSDPDTVREQLESISEQSAQAIDEVKEISYNLRPYLLDRLGLTKALEAIIGKVADSSGLDISFESGQIDGVFSKEAEINLYRIIQESLNNIVKHAGATETQVVIKRHEHAVLVIVSDNGRGFDNAERGKGFGLIGIAERARMLGGDLVIHSAPGDGVTIKMELSLKGGVEARHGE